MSPKIIHIIGARPNFPKAAPVVQALAKLDVSQKVVHTGQHYDERMSDAFIRQLGMPQPDINLGVGSGSHASQTASVMQGLEPIILEERPQIVVVYGDVNSTLAAALVSAKLGITVAHVEAGLRSGDRSMPEEINRILTDQLSDILFATCTDAMVHLGNEGVAPSKIHFVGNPMIDSLLGNLQLFDAAKIVAELDIDGPYAVATLHRPANVDSPESAIALVKALQSAAEQIQIVLPLHPRGRQQLEKAGLFTHPKIKIIDPLGYIEFVSLMRGSAVVLTDSGGVQEETTVLGIPCLTLRPNTERPATITHGTNRLIDLDSLPAELDTVLRSRARINWKVPPLWDGKAGPRIAEVLQGIADAV